MGALLEMVKLNLLVYGDSEASNFKANSLFFYEKYTKSDDMVKSIPLTNIKKGGFYFFHYLDDSNWMKWSPVFIVDFKKFDDKIILFAVNLNFIPLKVSVMLFDPYIKEEDFDKDLYMKVDYSTMYSKLSQFKFQYSLMEFNLLQIKYAHKIHMKMLPRFLYSQHPKNVYDPNKLMDIWKKKLKTSDLRDKEMMESSIDDFFDINNEISEKYNMLKGHIERLQKSIKKYGG